MAVFPVDILAGERRCSFHCTQQPCGSPGKLACLAGRGDKHRRRHTHILRICELPAVVLSGSFLVARVVSISSVLCDTAMAAVPTYQDVTSLVSVRGEA